MSSHSSTENSAAKPKAENSPRSDGEHGFIKLPFSATDMIENPICDAAKPRADRLRDRLARGLHFSEHGKSPTTVRQSIAVSIRRALLSDYPRIAAFIREAYEESAPFKERERWEWQFVNNPYLGSEDGRVPVWIAEVPGKVVGQIAVQAGAIEIDGVTHPAGWIVDVMILPAYRGLGLGHRLYTAVAAECPILVTLTMAEATRRMAERLGAVDLGEVKLYSRLIHLDGRTVQRYLQTRTTYHPRIRMAANMLCRYFFIHRILAGAGNILLSLRNTLVGRPWARNGTHVIPTDRFGPEIDLLWQRVQADFPVAFTREGKFLNWRFCECPQMRYRLFTAFRDGKTVGYMVLRESEPVELPHGIIVDLVAARQDRSTVEDLVAFALEFFGERVAGVDCATSIPEFGDILRRFGFQSIRTERPNCVTADPAVQERLEKSSTDWLFSKADHDWDQIHVG